MWLMELAYSAHFIHLGEPGVQQKNKFFHKIFNVKLFFPLNFAGDTMPIARIQPDFK